MERSDAVPTMMELDSLYRELKNWGRWGPDDQRGTLNHLTNERRVAAARLVVTGETISLAHDLATEPVAAEHPNAVQHHMLAAGDARDSNGIAGYEAARDHLALDIHGLWTTHVDALSHMFVRGEMFGGLPASEVRSDGARANTVMAMADGVVGRGVLLDVPRATGREFFDQGELVTVADLEATERSQEVSVGPGDVLLVAWGRESRRRAKRGFDGFSGLHPQCLTWLQDGRWQCSAATASRIPFHSPERSSGPSRFTRLGSPPWACTSSTTCGWLRCPSCARRPDDGSSSSQ